MVGWPKIMAGKTDPPGTPFQVSFKGVLMNETCRFRNDYSKELTIGKERDTRLRRKRRARALCSSKGQIMTSVCKAALHRDERTVSPSLQGQ